MFETNLTVIERKIMNVIWNTDHRMALAEIRKRVNDKFNAGWRPQTISTYLAHLIRKGWLSMERSGKVFLYTPEISAEDCLNEDLNSLFEYYSEMNLVDFLNTFPKERLCNEERNNIRILLNQYDCADK